MSDVLMNSGERREAECVLLLRVIPRAKRSEVVGMMEDGRLKIKIKSPPVDGKANQALIDLLAKVLGIKRGAIGILSGAAARNKQVAIYGMGEREALNKLMKVATGAQN